MVALVGHCAVVVSFNKTGPALASRRACCHLVKDERCGSGPLIRPSPLLRRYSGVPSNLLYCQGLCEACIIARACAECALFPGSVRVCICPCISRPAEAAVWSGGPSASHGRIGHALCFFSLYNITHFSSRHCVACRAVPTRFFRTGLTLDSHVIVQVTTHSTQSPLMLN